MAGWKSYNSWTITTAHRETGLGYKKQEKLTNIEIQLTKLNMWQVVLGWNQQQIGALSSWAHEHAGERGMGTYLEVGSLTSLGHQDCREASLGYKKQEKLINVQIQLTKENNKQQWNQQANQVDNLKREKNFKLVVSPRASTFQHYSLAIFKLILCDQPLLIGNIK